MDALPANRTWPTSCSHGTYQHKAITSRSRQLLMMGTRLPETCWATIRREIRIQKVTSSWFFLSTLNNDARSTTHQIYHWLLIFLRYTFGAASAAPKVEVLVPQLICGPTWFCLQEVQKLDFSAIPSSLEVSRDGSTLTITHGNVVSFWDAQRYEPPLSSDEAWKVV